MASCANCGNELPADTAECPNCTTQVLTAGRAAGMPEISGYKILRRIGEGGMGAIYLAEETSLGRRVAIKLIAGKVTAEEQARARFGREARALATVEHANVVRVYSFGDVGGQPYLAMEYVDGETLADRIHRLGRLPVEEAVRFTREILVALEAAWEKGIVHRDIKPSNILIDRRSQVHVADFGLAKTLQLADDMILTQSGHVLGTPYYVAPEQAQGKATDFRADIYSTGILLYEMLAGERPFEGTTPFTVVAKHLNEPLPSIRAKRPDVPNKVARILERMTAKKPEERPQSYAELIGAFDTLLGITPKSIPRTETFSQLPTARKMSYRTPLIISALVILSIVGWQWYRVSKMPAPAMSVAEPRLVVAVTPFYGPDDDSAKEGRVMAALVERSITSRLGADNVRVIGIDETKQPVRSHDAARQLGETLRAAVVVWGEAFALKRETEIQPYFTLIRRARSQAPAAAEKVGSIDVKAADPVAKLSEQSTAVMRVQAEAPNQIELRKTSAEGVGAMVSFLAALHALYDENNPRKALKFFAQAPKTAESLRHRAQAEIQIGDQATAMKTLEEALALEPNHVQSRAQLADLHLLAGRFKDAAAEYQRVAGSGEMYTTNYGIAHRGLVYVREVFRPPDASSNELKDTGTLLAVAPETEIVARRWRLPGAIHSFEPRPDGFSIRYAADQKETRVEMLTFRGNDFGWLPPPGGNLLLRMQSMKVAWVLPQNFTADLGGILEKRPAHPRLRLTSKPFPDLPQTLPDLESALRTAAGRDPTQPWHLFWLGQTLWAEGKQRDAETIWRRIVTTDYPGITYVNYNWMARFFESLGQRNWADRIFDKAMRERRRLPQPVQFSTLIERLINVQFMRMHPEQLKDPQRAYAWLQRARMISGPTESDHYAAAAWAGHFRRMGDLTRARIEQQNARALALHPFNFTALHSRIDYAFYALFATWFGFIGSAALIFFKADRHRPTIKQYLRTLNVSLKTRVPKQWLPFMVGGAIASVLIVAAGIAIGVSWSKPAGIAFVAIALSFFAHISGLQERGALIYRELPNRDRLALLLMFILFTSTTVITNSVTNRVAAISLMPIGVADSLGHPVLIADLESRLAKSPTPDLRYLTAVANQLGGKFERAKELYQQLPKDSRARHALAELESGRAEIVMPEPDKIFRAYSAEPLSFFAGMTRFNEPETFLKLGVVAWFVISLLLLIPCAFIRPAPQISPPQGPRTKTGRVLAKIGFILVPGSFDLLRRSILRGVIAMTLFGFSLLFAFSMWKAFPVLQSPGIFTAISTPNMAAAFPFPPDISRLDLMFAPPYARLFWFVALLAVVSLAVLHLTRIPSILARYGDEPAPAPASLESAEQPA